MLIVLIMNCLINNEPATDSNRILISMYWIARQSIYICKLTNQYK